MATDTSINQELATIGTVAGMIWRYLEGNGPVTLSKLAKEIDASRDQVMQGIGWLAREGKIHLEETPRAKMISLVS
jgi:Mn-dependent DtxR family transcriptional regulator